MNIGIQNSIVLDSTYPKVLNTMFQQANQTMAKGSKKVSECSRDSQDKSADSTGTFRFQELPSEIRHRIYRLALTCVSEKAPPYTIMKRTKAHSSSPSTPPSCLSLLLSCRQIYLEAFPIFYRVNQLYFVNTNDLFYFLIRIGQARRQEVRAIRFTWRGDHPKRAFRLLKTCTSLTTITFGMQRRQPSGYVALREVRGLKHVIIKRQALECDIRDNRPGVTNRPDADIIELERAMMRPRLARYHGRKEVNLFKKDRFSRPRRTEEEILRDEYKKSL